MQGVLGVSRWFSVARRSRTVVRSVCGVGLQGGGPPGQREDARLEGCLSIHVPRPPDPSEPLETGEIMVSSQCLGRDDNRFSRLLAARSGLLGDGLLTKAVRCRETATRIGQKRGVAAFQSKAPTPAVGVDRRNATAIAVQSVPGHHLAAERDQPQSLDRRIAFRATPCGHRRQRQTQPGSLGPGPSSQFARSVQGLAIDRYYVAVLEQLIQIVALHSARHWRAGRGHLRRRTGKSAG
jgi:hypothetical protein